MMFADAYGPQCSQPTRASLSAGFVSARTRIAPPVSLSSVCMQGRFKLTYSNLKSKLHTYSTKLTGSGVSSRSSDEGRPHHGKDSTFQAGPPGSHFFGCLADRLRSPSAFHIDTKKLGINLFLFWTHE